MIISGYFILATRLIKRYIKGQTVTLGQIDKLAKWLEDNQRTSATKAEILEVIK